MGLGPGVADADLDHQRDLERVGARVEVADVAPLEASLLAALDLTMLAAAAFEVQTDAGIWSREDRPGWLFETWAHLEASG